MFPRIEDERDLSLFLSSFAGPLFDKCQFISAISASGGIVTCWNSRDFICTEVIVRVFSLTLRLKHLASGLSFFLSNVYDPPTWEGKVDFCSELVALKEHRPHPRGSPIIELL